MTAILLRPGLSSLTCVGASVTTVDRRPGRWGISLTVKTALTSGFAAPSEDGPGSAEVRNAATGAAPHALFTTSASQGEDLTPINY